MQYKKIKEIRPEDRPYERCLRDGPSVLSDPELLAVILRTGTRGISSLELASRILSLCPQEPGLTGLYHLTAEELRTQTGIGVVKAVQIQCIGELSRRIARARAVRGPAFTSASRIAAFYMETLRHREQECVHCMMLDIRGQLLQDLELTRGTVDASLLSPREVFLKALQYHAVQIVLVHNHPSGDARPSRQDLELTERIIGGGKLVGIRVLDHVIIGDQCYISLREWDPGLFSDE